MKTPRKNYEHGYPVVYLDNHGNIFCAECADAEEEESFVSTTQAPHWEGDPLACERCTKIVESAYGGGYCAYCNNWIDDKHEPNPGPEGHAVDCEWLKNRAQEETP